MKKLLLASAATIALVATASAADLGPRPVYKAAPVAPPVPVFSWTGCHVGAHVGWGWGRKDVFSGKVNSQGAVTSTESDSGTGKLDTSGAILGGQVGCDYQLGFGKGAGGLGAWVIGLEGSFAGTDIHGFDHDPADVTEGDEVIRLKTDWLASFTGRLGFAGIFPQTLWYVRGGAAWVRDKWDLSQTHNIDRFDVATVSQNRTGWTVGVGVEWAFAPNWSAFIEYDHYDFGDKNVIKVPWNRFSDDFAVIDGNKQRIEAVKIGVNYRLNWFGKSPSPVVARY